MTISRKPLPLASLLLIVFGTILSTHANGAGPLKWAYPPIVDPGPAPESPAAVPSDAVILFDGKDMSAWDSAEKWVVADCVVTAAPPDITTKQPFGDCQFHIEFKIPTEPAKVWSAAGNSGIYFMGLYEVQIFDSYKNQSEIYADGQAGAIYKQTPPLVNACRDRGQ